VVSGNVVAMNGLERFGDGRAKVGGIGSRGG
jgi:hypothetical protein